MTKGIIFHNTNNSYLGLDRSCSIWNDSLRYNDNSFLIDDEYCVSEKYISDLIYYYNDKKLYIEGLKLIIFTNDLFNDKYFKLIGFDCGNVYDNEDDFFIGFSTIANEVIRMDNPLCLKYKRKLNNFLLFNSINEVESYRKEREKKIEIYRFENAFENFMIFSIYLYI